jgi:hypothetical protein
VPGLSLAQHQLSSGGSGLGPVGHWPGPLGCTPYQEWPRQRLQVSGNNAENCNR